MVNVTQSECIKRQGKYQTQRGECRVLYWLLRRLYRFTTALETLSALLLWSDHSDRHLVPAGGHNRRLVGALQEGKSEAG